MSYTSNISLATEQQNDIGWQAMAKGWTTEDFKDFLFKYFSGNPEKIKILSSVDWEAWFQATARR